MKKISILSLLVLSILAASCSLAADYDKLLALAGEDDLLMVYADPPPNIIPPANVLRVEPEPGISGAEILIVNVSKEELHIEYLNLPSAPNSPTTAWESLILPGQAIILDTLYSEGIPNRGLRIYESGTSVAECEIIYDAIGDLGPVFVKRGDSLPPRDAWYYYWDDPE